MEVFNLLAIKIAPLYLIVLLGVISVKYFFIDRKQIAKLLIYIVSPFVVFHGTVTAQLSIEYISIPFIWGSIAILISLIFYNLSKRIWGAESAKKNILALMAGTGNTGYFGIPVALLLFGNKAFSICVLIVMGNMLFEYSLGFYLAARGNYSKADSLQKVLRLPNLYAFALGIFVNYLGLTLNQDVEGFLDFFKGAYSLLGVMMIGMGIGTRKSWVFDFKFINFAMFIKFIIWPIVIFGLVYLDKHFIHFVKHDIIYLCVQLISFVPLPANAVAFSSELNLYPEKVSVAVLLSTLLALMIIPMAYILFF